MKNLLRVALVCALSWLPCIALAQSTVNPAVPVQNAPLASAPVRSNFAATNSDINGLLTMHPASLVSNCSVQSQTVGADCLVTGSPTAFQWYKYMGANGFALIATINPSTNPPVVTPTLPTIASGHLLANCTGGTTAAQDCSWTNYANTAIGSTNGMLPYRTGGAWSTILTGTAGATIPLNNTANVFSALQTVTLNATTLPSPVLTNQVLRLGGANGVSARIEVDNFGGASYLSAVSYGGNNGSPAALVAATELGGVNSWGYNGSTIIGPQASFRMYANQNWSVGANGTYADIATTPNGSTTLTQVVKFENDGGITVPGTVTGGSKGAGTLNLTNGLYNNGTAPVGSGGGYVLSNSPTLVTPNIGVANGASLALGGATLGSNVLAVTGLSSFGGAVAVTSSSVNGFVVGPNGATNPTLNVVTNIASEADGLQVTGGASGSGLALAAVSPSTNTPMSVNAKGSGIFSIANVSTGATNIGSGGGGVTVNAPVAEAGATTGTCTNGWAENSSHQLILVACPGAAASIQVGATTVTSGSTGNILYNNAGTLGNTPLTAGNGISLSGTANATITSNFAVKSDQVSASSAVLSVNPSVQQFHPSALKAWASFTACTVNGVCTLSASYGITQISRNSVGNYTITFSTAFTSAAGISCNGGTSNVSSGGIFAPNFAAATTTTLTFATFTISGTLTDFAYTSVHCSGTQ